MDLPLARAREQGQLFETGRPVTLVYIRNTEKSPNLGSRFQQDIEPAGRYLLVAPDPTSPLPRGWERGVISFDSPLVLDFGRGYDETSWKWALAEHYGLTGRRLSRRLLRDGFDAIVTVDDMDRQTREVVDLTHLQMKRGRR